MKLTMLEVDWKDDFTVDEINEAALCVGGDMSLHEYSQDDVDAKVMFVCSERLDREQFDRLWKAGDLATAEDVWDGDFESVLAQVRARLEANLEA